MSGPQKARALFQFQATQAGDLSFEEDEIITVLKQNNNGWWEGVIGQRRGEFPFNYVEILTTKELAELMAKKIQEANGQMGGNKGDSVTDIQVVPVAKSTSLKITLALASGSRVEGQKNVADFRTLDDKLREIYHDFDSTLPPMWADKAYFSEESNARRAGALTLYLKKLVANPVKQFAMVDWLNPRSNFKTAPEVKKQVAGAAKGVATSNRNSFRRAMESAPALAKVEFNWTPHDAVELQLIKKEVIAVLSRQTLSPGWWEGQNLEGQRGLFPYNHVKLLSAEEATSLVQGERSTQMKAIPAKKPVPESKSVKPTRARITHKMFALGSMDSFDALLVDGFTMEKDGRLVSDNVTNAPGPGDRCVMSYIGYVWDCQSQSIIEFASSDLPDKDGNIRKLEFTMNRDEVIKGIELAAGFMEKGQSVRLIVKPELAYGDVGFPQLNIPPNVHLVYDITLDDFSSAALPGPPVATGQSNMYANAEAPKTLAEAIARQQQQTQQDAFPNFNAPIQNRPGRGHGNNIKGYKAGGGQQVQKPPPPSQAKKGGGGGGGKAKAPAGAQYDLNKMREIVRTKKYAEYGVQAAFLEENLTDQAFKEAFRCDRSAFILMPRWKQMKMKKDARLF